MEEIISTIVSPETYIHSCMKTLSHPRDHPIRLVYDSKSFYYYPQNRNGTLFSLSMSFTTTQVRDMMQVLDCLLPFDFSYETEDDNSHDFVT
jgi:hypothetical protein